MAELAQVNVAIMRAPLRHPAMAQFVAAFDPVARLARESPGFCWQLGSQTGHTVVEQATGESQVVNVSVWRDYQALHEFVYRSAHGVLLLRRGDWFLPAPQPSTALWWQRDGERPTAQQALARLQHLRDHGPTPRAFTLTHQFSPQGQPVRRRPAASRRTRG